MKILGSDYDGTLTCGGIEETKIAAIHRWREAGNRFGIVTGRVASFRQRLLEEKEGRRQLHSYDYEAILSLLG